MAEELKHTSEELMARKPLNIIFIGHVDSGKSTLNGRLLVDTENVDMRELDRLRSDAEKTKMESWVYARVLDTYDEERVKGKTMDCGYAFFMTENRKFYLIDAPGHAGLVPRMASFCHQADVACLLVSARAGEFEAGMNGGQSCEHLMIAKTAGVRKLVVAVNKMDDPSVNWSKERYDQIKTEITNFLKRVGFNPKDVPFLPIAALSGSGIARPVGDDAPWYNGPSLLNLFDTMEIDSLPVDAPLRMSIIDRYKENNNICLRGKIDSGRMRVGDKFCCVPGDFVGEVTQVNEDDSPVEEASAGDNVSVYVKGTGSIPDGAVMCPRDDKVTTATEVVAQLIVMDNPTSSEGLVKPVSKGFSSIAHCHAIMDEVTITEVLGLMKRKMVNGRPAFKVVRKATKTSPVFLRKGETGLVRLRFSEPRAVSTKDGDARMSRFVLREDTNTIAVGIITKLRN